MSIIVTQLINLKPHNNQNLKRLCGTNEKHLKMIEDYFNVNINHRGFDFQISGDSDKRNIKQVATSLEKIYQQANQSELDVEEVHLTLQTLAVFSNSSELKEVNLTIGKKNLLIKTKNQKDYYQKLKNNQNSVVFASGPAGTGKTFLAVAHAVESIKNGAFKKIVLTRPAVEAGEQLGFLPGDLTEKIWPYLQPLYDAIYQLLDKKEVEKLIEYNGIEIAPLAFMRGRTLNESYIILDEGQNTTVAQMKMFLTRLGYQSKMVITGDQSQIDLPLNKQSGFINACEILKDTQGVRIAYFSEKDVMRHHLVKDIINAYENQN